MADMIRASPYDYYYGREAEQFSFIKVPKRLFTDQAFKIVSSEAKLLYGVLLDRMHLSMKQGWLDDCNRVYIIYTVDELMEVLNYSRQKIVRYLAELDCEKGIGLIEKKRLGQGKPNLIYVKNFIPSESNERTESTINTEKFQYGISRNSNMETLEVPIWNCNKTDSNKTDSSNTQSIHQEIEGEEWIDRVRELICENVEYSILCERYDQRALDELIELMASVFAEKGGTVRIGKQEISRNVVKSSIMKLTFSHVVYILECLKKNRQKIHNIRAYLLTTIYNAPKTMNHFYQQEVNFYESG